MPEVETIMLPKAEYDALLDRLEDADDALSVKQFRASVEAQGWDSAIKDCLPVDLVERKLAGKQASDLPIEAMGPDVISD
jgi:hypothetical protein